MQKLRMDLQSYARMKKLSRSFYSSPETLSIARDLLGKLLVVPDSTGKRVSGMIVETEAYLGVADRAAHSYGGRRTKRNEVMYASGGSVYVFFVYGMYYQLNVVCGKRDVPTAILIRGVAPVEGVEVMRERRGKMKDENLTSGPGKLSIAFDIDRSLNGEDLTGERIWIEKFRSFGDAEITAGPRIGIDYAGEDVEQPWRFWLTDNPYVSGKSK